MLMGGFVVVGNEERERGGNGGIRKVGLWCFVCFNGGVELWRVREERVEMREWF